MRRYTIAIDDTEHVLDVEQVGSDLFAVHLPGGRLVEARLVADQDLAGGLVTPSIAPSGPADQTSTSPASTSPGRTSPASTSPASTSPGRTTAAARPRSNPRPAPGPARSAAGAGTLAAPMPGVVLSVSVAAGQAVSRGQTLLVLEAMKMKNELKAQGEGIVARVRVGAGDQVKHGDPLVEFEI